MLVMVFFNIADRALNLWFIEICEIYKLVCGQLLWPCIYICFSASRLPTLHMEPALAFQKLHTVLS